jgi:hypothetical protein
MSETQQSFRQERELFSQTEYPRNVPEIQPRVLSFLEDEEIEDGRDVTNECPQ